MALGFYIVGIMLVVFNLTAISCERTGVVVPFMSFIVGVGLIIYALIIAHEPTAMDVYRDNTTLEITYRNGIPVDSTVVFK